MSWTTDLGHPFAGIAEKLKRTDENIVNLHREIIAFFEKSEYPILPKPDDQRWQEAVDYHSRLRIPIRFSVLAGEIVHHLRSSLDHIVWIFSNDAYRLSRANAIEFPVLCKIPDKDKAAKFERNIKGVDKPSVRKLITDLQPYQSGASTINNPLCIIHDMDRFDKHRELVIVTACANLTFPAGTSVDLVRKVMAYKQGEPLTTSDVDAVQRTMKQDAEVRPQISFAKLGKRETEFAIPVLAHLLNTVDDVVSMFASEI
jgi:hypothetical protein